MARICAAGELQLREGRDSKRSQLPAHQVSESSRIALPRRAQRLDCVLISSKRAVVADVNVLASEPKLMVRPRPVHIVVELNEVLRTAERNCVAGSGRAVTRESDWETRKPSGEGVVDIQRRSNGLIRQRLLQIQAIVRLLCSDSQGSRECVCNIEQVVLIAGRLSGVEADKRTEVYRAVKQAPFLIHSAQSTPEFCRSSCSQGGRLFASHSPARRRPDQSLD